MRSLEAFIECNGQWEAAARRLYCHRHTLRYRIRKIEELTGRDLGQRPRPHRVLAGPARPRARRRTQREHEPEGRRPDRDQDRRVPRRADARRACASWSITGMRCSCSRRGRGWARRSPTTTTSSRARGSCPTPTRCSRRRSMIVKVKEPQPVEVARLRAAPHAVHLPAPRAGRRADAGADRLGRDVHRLRDGRGRARAAAAAGADERGRGQDRHAGRGVHAREAARRPRDAAGRRAGRARPAKVMVIGGGVVGMNAAEIAIGMGAETYVYRPQHRPPARARRACSNGRCSTCFASTLAIEQHLPEADLVIGAVLVHGRARRRTSSRASSSG